MGKFSEGRGEVLWLDPCYGIMIQLLLLSKQGVQIGKENYRKVKIIRDKNSHFLAS